MKGLITWDPAVRVCRVQVLGDLVQKHEACIVSALFYSIVKLE